MPHRPTEEESLYLDVALFSVCLCWTLGAVAVLFLFAQFLSFSDDTEVGITDLWI